MLQTVRDRGEGKLNMPIIDNNAMSIKAKNLGISLSPDQLAQLEQYAQLLVEWNTRMNLTGITDGEGIMTRHFEDSLALLSYVSVPEGAKIIDVGTGAGFPGMVLKIARPDLQLTLLDSLHKRLVFLEEVARTIGLEVRTLHLRAEEGGKIPAFREQFDIACARAVSNLRELAEYCLPYVRVGGQFVSMKGPDAGEELHSARPAIGTLGGKVSFVKEYSISDGSGRTIIVVEKCKSTPSQFPRPSAKISKKPL